MLERFQIFASTSIEWNFWLFATLNSEHSIVMLNTHISCVLISFSNVFNFFSMYEWHNRIQKTKMKMWNMKTRKCVLVLKWKSLSHITLGTSIPWNQWTIYIYIQYTYTLKDSNIIHNIEIPLKISLYSSAACVLLLLYFASHKCDR